MGRGEAKGNGAPTASHAGFYGAGLEPDPRYQGRCSHLFRPGHVMRDCCLGLLVLIIIGVVIGAMFLLVFFVLQDLTAVKESDTVRESEVILEAAEIELPRSLDSRDRGGRREEEYIINNIESIFGGADDRGLGTSVEADSVGQLSAVQGRGFSSNIGYNQLPGSSTEKRRPATTSGTPKYPSTVGVTRPVPTEPQMTPTQPQMTSTQPQMTPTQPQMTPTQPQMNPTQPQMTPTQPPAMPAIFVPVSVASNAPTQATSAENAQEDFNDGWQEPDMVLLNVGKEVTDDSSSIPAETTAATSVSQSEEDKSDYSTPVVFEPFIEVSSTSDAPSTTAQTTVTDLVADLVTDRGTEQVTEQTTERVTDPVTELVTEQITDQEDETPATALPPVIIAAFSSSQRVTESDLPSTSSPYTVRGLSVASTPATTAASAPEGSSTPDPVESIASTDNDGTTDVPTAVTEGATDQSFTSSSAATADADGGALTSTQPPVTEVPADAFTVTEAPAEAFTVTEAPAEAFTVTEAPAEAFTVTEAPAEAFTVTEAPAEAFTVTEAPAEAFTATEAPAEAFVVTEAPAEASTVTEAPAEAFTVTEAPAEAFTVTETPAAVTESSTDGSQEEKRDNYLSSEQTTTVEAAIDTTTAKPVRVAAVDVSVTTEEIVASATAEPVVTQPVATKQQPSSGGLNVITAPTNLAAERPAGEDDEAAGGDRTPVDMVEIVVSGSAGGGGGGAPVDGLDIVTAAGRPEWAVTEASLPTPATTEATILPGGIVQDASRTATASATTAPTTEPTVEVSPTTVATTSIAQEISTTTTAPTTSVEDIEEVVLTTLAPAPTDDILSNSQQDAASETSLPERTTLASLLSGGALAALARDDITQLITNSQLFPSGRAFDSRPAVQQVEDPADQPKAAPSGPADNTSEQSATAGAPSSTAEPPSTTQVPVSSSSPDYVEAGQSSPAPAISSGDPIDATAGPTEQSVMTSTAAEEVVIQTTASPAEVSASGVSSTETSTAETSLSETITAETSSDVSPPDTTSAETTAAEIYIETSPAGTSPIEVSSAGTSPTEISFIATSPYEEQQPSSSTSVAVSTSTETIDGGVCPSGELRCLDGACISLQQLCDGIAQCSDAADELNCSAEEPTIDDY